MTRLRKRLARGFGLRARMTASYVLVTFAAVIVVEGLAAVLVIPNVNQEADLASRVVNTANMDNKRFGGAVVKVVAQGSDPMLAAQILGTQPMGDGGIRLGPGQVQTQDQGVRIPQVDTPLPDSAPMSLLLVLSPKGVIYGSSYPGRFAPNTAVGGRLPPGWNEGGSAVSKLSDGKVAWASEAILPSQPEVPDLNPKVSAPKAVAVGFIYVQVPVPDTVALDPATVQPLVRSGLIFLLVSVPVGVVFGTLTTRGTIRRLRSLATGTLGFAAGDFAHRVPESGSDEVGQLERHFNRMAGRLADSIAQQRALDERNARLAERSRISRELHDSISQDLFSMSALVAGLRKALPADSAVQPELETLGRTVGSTIREMRALLLELRPTALEEKGLVPALADLCGAYEVRVGIQVGRELEAVRLDAAGEQAVFRIAQEGLSNAARHSEADRIDVRLRAAGGGAELTVADNGRGFDRSAGTHGLGLRLMGERVRELGGSLSIDTAPGRGTEIRVVLPAAAG
jgi:signal transduction histidine kinase